MKRLMFSFAVFVALASWAPVKNGYEVGDTAADFKLKNVDGKMVSLSDWKDAKGFIVIFDCNTCPYSKAYNERIIALNSKYASNGFPVVAINSNDASASSGDSFEKMIDYAKKKGYTFPYLVDESQSVARAFGATNTPHVFVLNRVGAELKVAYIGTIDDSPRDASGVSKRYVEEAVDALLAGKPVAQTKTKAIGCGIKWKNS
ncbi:MAG: thioredoxin family protein [Cyclobacteriaceae bacterium]|nr:thioredoxin family protein [Cyclobacteriaceae bacterium]